VSASSGNLLTSLPDSISVKTFGDLLTLSRQRYLRTVFQIMVCLEFAAEQSEIADFRVHDLRRTFITRHGAAGVWEADITRLSQVFNPEFARLFEIAYADHIAGGSAACDCQAAFRRPVEIVKLF
jgi:hypothetical protein